MGVEAGQRRRRDRPARVLVLVGEADLDVAAAEAEDDVDEVVARELDAHVVEALGVTHPDDVRRTPDAEDLTVAEGGRLGRHVTRGRARLVGQREGRHGLSGLMADVDLVLGRRQLALGDDQELTVRIKRVKVGAGGVLALFSHDS